MTKGGFVWLAACIACLALAAPARAAIRTGMPAPELAGCQLAGDSVSLSQLRGKWVFVDFWASWCGPCMHELPNVVSLSKDMAPNPNFTVLGVSLDEKRTLGDMAKAIKKNGVTYPCIYSCDGSSDRLTAPWGISQIPTTFLIDPDGNIVGRDIPVRQVRALIEQGEMDTARLKPGARPDTQPAGPQLVQVKCREQLLPVSYTSGEDGGRDLEVVLDLKPGQPRVSKYRMYLRSTKTLPSGKSREANWRYDISVLIDPTNKRAPYFVEITDSSDKLKTGGFVAPELSAMLDLDANICQFIVPLDADTQRLNYAVAQYE